MPVEKCPICEKSFNCANKASHPTYPFCQARCQLIDFNRWCSGAYKIVEEIDLQQVHIEIGLEEQK